MANRPIKVAVLGGGVAGLAAAFELSDPRHNGKFAVTVYQLGWRLGGKCASGREEDVGHRIKEHGPHIFFGFYDNAFAILREVYRELENDPPRPFRTIEDALIPKSELITMEQVDGAWLPWVIEMPPLLGTPGEPLALNDLDILIRHLKAVQSKLLELAHLSQLEGQPLLLDAIEKTLSDTALLHLSEPLLSPRLLAEACNQVQQSLHLIFHGGQNLETPLRRLFILADLGLTVAAGALSDDLLWPTPEAVRAANELDYRQWLKKHGALDITIDSAVVRAMYDTVFAYPNGDRANPDVEAGSAVIAQKGLISYRGPFAWKMRAGTGDVTAAPLYQALVKRGVTFHFFHRVDRLLSSDGKTVDKIEIGRQATVIHEPYDPLIPCKDLAVWPDRPRYELLVEGADLERRNIDLEAAVTDWVDPQPPLTLSFGTDFDKVVLAIPIGGLGRVAPAPLKPAWQAALGNSQIVPTMSVQVWMNRTAADAGWDATAGPVVTGYDLSALDTWLDASEVVAYESWGDQVPRQMAILCGVQRLPGDIPPVGSPDFSVATAALASSAGRAFLNESVAFWPKLHDAGSFDWSALFAPRNDLGPDRFLSQYWITAAHPWDCYVLTPAGTSKFRLTPDGSGYDNLALAGDWTDYGMNLGSFEGAVTSGLLAANAITRNPRPILRNPFDRN